MKQKENEENVTDYPKVQEFLHSFRNSEPDYSLKNLQAYSNRLRNNSFLVNSEAATGGVLSKYMFSEISQI